MKRWKGFIVIISVICIIYLWFWGLNPARVLKNSEITEAAVYSLSPKTLWEIGFSPEDCTAPEGYSPDYHCIFSMDVTEKITDALKTGRSYYVLKDRQSTSIEQFSFYLETKDGAAFIFIVPNVEDALSGKFYGTKLDNNENDNFKNGNKLYYYNQNLGEVLNSLVNN